MDSKSSDLTEPKADTLASLDELYTDFDQWLEKFRKFILKRCQELSRRTTPSKFNEQNINLQEILVHGIFVRKMLLSNEDKMRDFDSYVSNDYVILAIMGNNKYTRAKL